MSKSKRSSTLTLVEIAISRNLLAFTSDGGLVGVLDLESKQVSFMRQSHDNVKMSPTSLSGAYKVNRSLCLLPLSLEDPMRVCAIMDCLIEYQLALK